jgi:hypothetical protein
MQMTTSLTGHRISRDAIEKALTHHAKNNRISFWTRAMRPHESGHRIQLNQSDATLITHSLRESAIVTLALRSAALGSAPRRLGDMDPAERSRMTRRAMAQVGAELEANAPAIGAIMDAAESGELDDDTGKTYTEDDQGKWHEVPGMSGEQLARLTGKEGSSTTGWIQSFAPEGDGRHVLMTVHDQEISVDTPVRVSVTELETMTRAAREARPGLPPEVTGQVLTELRKADRALMAGTVAELARQYGLSAMVTGEQHGSRQTSVDLAGPHGLKLTVQFRGDTPQASPDTYVLSWHGVDIDGQGWRLNPAEFGIVNSVHGHKATDVARGFSSLEALLTRRFTRIADGSAFIAPDSAG